MRDGQFEASGWVRCSCGKERHIVVYESTQDLADLSLKVYDVCACRACQADHSIALDSCPEWVHVEDAAGRGVAACALAWHHEGRCQPDHMPADIVASIRAAEKDGAA